MQSLQILFGVMLFWTQTKLIFFKFDARSVFISLMVHIYLMVIYRFNGQRAADMLLHVAAWLGFDLRSL